MPAFTNLHTSCVALWIVKLIYRSGHYFNTELSLQILRGMTWHYVQTFIVAKEWCLLTWRSPWLFLHAPTWGWCFCKISNFLEDCHNIYFRHSFPLSSFYNYGTKCSSFTIKALKLYKFYIFWAIFFSQLVSQSRLWEDNCSYKQD